MPKRPRIIHRLRRLRGCQRSSRDGYSRQRLFLERRKPATGARSHSGSSQTASTRFATIASKLSTRCASRQKSTEGASRSSTCCQAMDQLSFRSSAAWATSGRTTSVRGRASAGVAIAAELRLPSTKLRSGSRRRSRGSESPLTKPNCSSKLRPSSAASISSSSLSAM